MAPLKSDLFDELFSMCYHIVAVIFKGRNALLKIELRAKMIRC